MFNTRSVIRNHLLTFLLNYVRTKTDASWRRPEINKIAGVRVPSPGGEGQGEGDRGGPIPKPDAEVLLLQLPKCPLDIFIATPETWATRKLCRTGSKEHNIWLCDRARAHCGHWNPARGLTLHGDPVPATEEADLYHALGLDYIEPVNRELQYLRRLKP